MMVELVEMVNHPPKADLVNHSLRSFGGNGEKDEI